MTKTKTKKIIQLPMEDQQPVHRFEAKERDRLYVEGYQRHPEDLDWAESSAKLLSKRLRKEKW
jgi:hypothetical protein